MRQELIRNAYLTVAHLVNREHFGMYISENDILVVNKDGSETFLIDRQVNNLHLVTSLVLSGFEPKTVERASGSATTIEASIEGARCHNVPMMSKLIQDFIDNPIIRIYSKEAWLHSIVIGDVVVTYVWDTREIITIERMKSLKLHVDFEFVTNDMNTPIYMTDNTDIHDLQLPDFDTELDFGNPQTILTK